MKDQTLLKNTAAKVATATRWHEWKEYLFNTTRIVLGGTGAYLCVRFGPDGGIGAILSLVPLTYATGGINRLTEALKRNRMSVEHIHGDKNSKNLILVVEVNGVIKSEADRSTAEMLFGMRAVGGYDVQETLEDAADDERIKGVIVRISSPGGSIAGARAIFDGIVEYQKATKKPLIVHIDGICASGGIYAAVGASQIFAEPGALIGSIGVTLGTHHWYDNPIATTGGFGGVETRGGIKSYTLAAGKGKDLLSSWRKPDDEEIETLQEQIDELYDDFVAHVSYARNIKEDTIRNELGAYVFSNNSALAFGLIDGTKTRSEVSSYIARKAGLIDDDYMLVEQKQRRGIVSKLVSAETLVGAMAVYQGPGCGLTL